MTDTRAAQPGQPVATVRVHGGGFIGLLPRGSRVVRTPTTAHSGISRDRPSRAAARVGRRGSHQRTEQPLVNADDATPTGLATAHTGSKVHD